MTEQRTEQQWVRKGDVMERTSKRRVDPPRRFDKAARKWGVLVAYRCGGCKKLIERWVRRANATYESYCEKSGRTIKMRRATT